MVEITFDPFARDREIEKALDRQGVFKQTPLTPA